MQSFFDVESDYLEQQIVNWGESKFHAKQITQGVYKHYFADWTQFTMLSKNLRANLNLNYSLNNIQVINHVISKDQGTEKYLFHLKDGKPIESVLIRSNKGFTLCVSTQAGCGMGCKFCATGKMGFIRNLTPGEIIEQVVFFEKKLHENKNKLTNIVFMGMGEPFANFENLIKSLQVINHKDGLRIGARHITVSTIGIISRIIVFAQYFPQVNLAVSLHAPDNVLRSNLVPLNKKYPIEGIISTCKEYIAITNRRISFEYVLLNGVNDSEKHAHELAGLLKGMLCHVNLIVYNPIESTDFQPAPNKKMQLFSKILKSAGIPTSVRQSGGSEIHAGCGQLAGIS